jgi:hypothetical protein
MLGCRICCESHSVTLNGRFSDHVSLHFRQTPFDHSYADSELYDGVGVADRTLVGDCS